MRKETKIALFAIITLTLAIWGYKYLKGFNILSPKLVVYATCKQVDGLRVSTPIYIRGMQVGLVAEFYQKEGDIQDIVVEMHLDKDLKLPADTRAEIVTTSIMGGTAINLVYSGSCTDDACLRSGARIPGIFKGVLASFATPNEVKTYMDELSRGVNGLLDTLSDRLAQSKELNASVQDARAILANLHSTTDQLDRVMKGSSGAIQNSLQNIESITGTLKESNAQIKSILANVDAISGDLKEAELKKLVGETKATMEKLQGTLATSDKAIADLGILLKKMNEGEGVVSKLINDKELAENLEQVFKNIDLLVRDIRMHPERYRRILSKKKMEYEYVPLESDPAFQKN